MVGGHKGGYQHSTERSWPHGSWGWLWDHSGSIWILHILYLLLRVSYWVACERQTFLLAHRRWGTFREEERLRLSDRNSILMTQNLSGIRSEALIGRRSSFIVLAIVYEWQTKDKRRAAKVKCKRNESLTKQSICVEYSLLYEKHLSIAGAHSHNTTLFRNRPGEM